MLDTTRVRSRFDLEVLLGSGKWLFFLLIPET